MNKEDIKLGNNYYFVKVYNNALSFWKIKVKNWISYGSDLDCRIQKIYIGSFKVPWKRDLLYKDILETYNEAIEKVINCSLPEQEILIQIFKTG